MISLKKAAAVAIVALIVAAGSWLAYDNYVAAEWEDGVPTASVHIHIESVTDDSVYDGVVDIEPQSKIELATLHPFTTYTADVQPLDPFTLYTMTFSVVVKTSSAKPDEAFNTAVQIAGHNNRTMTLWNAPTEVNYTSGGFYSNNRIAEGSQPATNGVPVTITPAAFNGVISRTNTADWKELAGEHIDGATFLIEIISTSESGGYGMASATLNVVVGAGGDLVVGIEDISTSVSP